uniref:Uncharacterized protein n=1 Tax=Arundo donax TaxID=35708 RepID=A0A0A9EHL1_ARUDO
MLKPGKALSDLPNRGTHAPVACRIKSKQQ